MIRQIFIGLFSEGTTDNRFLESIVTRTFEEIGFECSGEVEIEVRIISITKSGKKFIEQVIEASEKGFNDYGIMILCVHTDADNHNDALIFQNKIIPAEIELNSMDDNAYCKILTAIVPIQMIEAWMLADKALLKTEIGTDKPDNVLGIDRQPESIADPKSVVEEAIRIARANLTKRRRRDLTIADLYSPVGQKIDLDNLDTLPSFVKFKEAIRKSYRQLNYMQ